MGERSTLDLPSPKQSGSHVLTLHLRPYVHEGMPTQRLRVLANGILVGSFLLTKATARACVLPREVIASRPSLSLVFETPDAARPTDLGADKDNRPLACAFSSLRLHRDQYGDDLEAEFGGAEPRNNSPATDLPLAELMLHFESLGQNCEFGLVQRQCGAEPLGLLRFASTSLAHLLAALEGGFGGMGSSKSIEIEVSSATREYMIRDRCYGVAYHAWLKAGDISAEELHQREVRRIPILVRKLLEELTLAEKLFVFRGMGELTEEEVFSLATTLRRYGPNKMLFVTLSDQMHRAGSVEHRLPGFLVGYIDRFAPGESVQDLLLDQWIAICREALRYNGLSALGLAG